MTAQVKRYGPFGVFVLGIAILAAVMHLYRAAQPRDVRITRGEARQIADVEARKLGIPVDRAWVNEVWNDSSILNKELEKDPARRRNAADDPVLGPRLGAYRINYYRRGLEKFPPYGNVVVSGKGEILAARLRLRPEDPGAQPTEAALRAQADAFVHSRAFPGAPNPQFESARPTVARSRTDWIFRYRVQSEFPTGKVVPYLLVAYNGTNFGGWELTEEYADGSPFRSDDSEIGGVFLRFGAMYVLLLIYLIIFLKKYHAGEVGVGTSTFLFALVLALAIAYDVVICYAASEGVGVGYADAQLTALAASGFKFLFVDLPFAVLVFLGWAIGESAARERWGERLASFEALLRREPMNATVGRSVIRGLLVAPGVAALAFLVGVIPVATRLAHPTLGTGSALTLYLGGPIANVLTSAADAIGMSVVAILFILATAARRRALALGIVIVAVLGAIGSIAELPIDPSVQRLLFGFGGPLAAIAVFLAYDLLTTVVALFFGSLLASTLPLMTVVQGDLRQQMLLTVGLPFLAFAIFGVAALLTKREVTYQYEDLAPHVKRIIERERVKAEIDAANRIQSALLPLDVPNLAGASVASHYRAATEIGGDYFDFLQQRNGEVGIAFGDVSGHGLTSGIVMAMAKAALLVQVDYDPSPRAVLEVLNNVVIKTAPRRILMTFFFGLLDPHAQTLRFSSAGHLDPYVYRAGTNKVEALSSWGFPLGVRRREPFREHTVTFAAGDRLVLYSDGLIEAVDDDGNPFGFDRFEHALVENGHRSADEIKKALLQSVRKFTRNRPPEDDQTLVVVSFDEVVAARMTPRAVAAGFSESVN